MAATFTGAALAAPSAPISTVAATAPETAFPAPAATAAEAAFPASPAETATSRIASTVAETTAFTLFHGPGLIDHDLPRTHAASVHLLDGRLGFQVGGHLDESKTLGATRNLVN